MVSGEEVAALSAETAEELRTVWALKHRLRRLKSFPVRLQEFVHDGCRLDDKSTLQVPMDVQLVLKKLQAPDPVAFVELRDAAGEGELEVVHLLINSIDSIDGCDLMEALQGAACHGQVEVVRLLLEAGAAGYLDFWTCRAALIPAIARGSTEIVQLLLEAGANKDFVDPAGRTLLMWAASQVCTAVARLLLDAGVAKDLTDKLGKTALMWASAGGHIETVSVLLRAGVAQDVADQQGNTAAMCARLNGHADVADLLNTSQTRHIFQVINHSDVCQYTASGLAGLAAHVPKGVEHEYFRNESYAQLELSPNYGGQLQE